MVRGKFRFHEVSEAPETSGIYAWYCRYELPQRDITNLLNDLQGKSCDNKHELVRAFLERYLFAYFQEPPYLVTMNAPLKAKYQGEVNHVASISSSLVERFVEQPERLQFLADILSGATPEFASPIYIGSAKSIRRRLLNHVDLIRRFREGLLNLNAGEIAKLEKDEERADHSFAREVAVVRRFDPNDLWAHTLDLEFGHEYIFDIENILNRINFPLCGRN